MHFDSSAVNAGATAMLESRTLYPKRGFQCLQFFLYNSGGAGDQLNIYIREYSAGAPNGTLVLVEEIKGTVPAPSRCSVPPASGQGPGLCCGQEAPRVPCALRA